MGEAIFGAFGRGGFAREVMPIARHFLADRPDYGIAPDQMVFVDRQRGDAPVNGHAVLSEDDFAAHPAVRKYFCVAVGDGRLRQAITARALNAGYRLLSLASRHAVVMDAGIIG
ncbi:MAG TPA: acetyltransferase, partial [Patescibacteria group bacterium]|nr:acetyltransferase [Patescibacteria group bacterium]